MDDALSNVHRLNNNGFDATVDILGEHVSNVDLFIKKYSALNQSGHLNPGMPKPPVALEISSEVFDFS